MTRIQRKLSFEEWIDKMGIDTLASRLAVDRKTILHWRARRCDPRVDYMRRMKRMSQGQLGYEQMIDRATPTNTVARGAQR